MPLKLPTIINAGAVTALVTHESNGEKKTDNKKHTPVVTAVKPVLPPTSTPEVDSTNDVTVEVPAIEPITVPIESANKARSTFSGFPVSSTKFALLHTATKVPAVSKKINE